MKEYWFIIYPHCFLWLKEEEGLVYNTQSYARVRFRNEGLLAEKAIFVNRTILGNVVPMRTRTDSSGNTSPKERISVK